MTPEFREKLRRLAKERRDKNYARHLVRTHVKNGKLKKEPCKCGETKVEAHHTDYTLPLDVIWACKTHHVELDRMKREREIEDETGLIL